MLGLRLELGGDGLLPGPALGGGERVHWCVERGREGGREGGKEGGREGMKRLSYGDFSLW